MYPVPTVSDLAAFSGRDEATYTGYANAALLQATIRFTFLTEVTDPAQFTGYNALTSADQQVLALNGICALADNIYLQFPYQQVVASPLQSETVGSHTYQKSMAGGAMGGSMSRMAPAALELSMATTGIPLFDMAVQLLALRTIASGVFHEGMSVFDEGERKSRLGAAMYVEDDNGRRWILGPGDKDNKAVPFSVNSQAFPMDPGVLASNNYAIVSNVWGENRSCLWQQGRGSGAVSSLIRRSGFGRVRPIVGERAYAATAALSTRQRLCSCCRHGKHRVAVPAGITSARWHIAVARSHGMV